MKPLMIKTSLLIALILTPFLLSAQDFQGKAYYFSKSTMELGKWGATMSEAQKKQIQERLKNRLEKTYILTFNKEASVFKEDEKIDAVSGATDSWGKNFTPGDQYKNVKTKILMQKQEFYGKQFLVEDKLLEIAWSMGSETKKNRKLYLFQSYGNNPSSRFRMVQFFME